MLPILIVLWIMYLSGSREGLDDSMLASRRKENGWGGYTIPGGEFRRLWYTGRPRARSIPWGGQLPAQTHPPAGRDTSLEKLLSTGSFIQVLGFCLKLSALHSLVVAPHTDHISSYKIGWAPQRGTCMSSERGMLPPQKQHLL